MSQIVAPNRQFWGLSFKFATNRCVLPKLTKIWLYVQKIGYNLVCAGDKSQIFVPNWGSGDEPIKWGHANLFLANTPSDVFLSP